LALTDFQEALMANNSRTQQIGLVLCALILVAVIALIVLIVNGRGDAALQSEVGGLRSEVVELKKSVDAQAGEIKSLLQKPDRRLGQGPAEDAGFKPVPLPDPKIPGFVFPEEEATIVAWTDKGDQHAINRHGWGIWAALTSPSGEQFGGQDLLVFETWLTPEDLLTARLRGQKDLEKVPRDPLPLRQLRQFRAPKKAAGVRATFGESTVLGFVKFDPSAARFIVDQNLLSKAALAALLKAGDTDIPNFPNTAVSLKPVFQTLSQGQLVGGRYFMLAAWPGPPAQPQSFPDSAWKQCVWVDVADPGPGKGTGKVDTSCKTDGSSRTDETTYGLGRFIHFKLSAAQARAVNAIAEAVHGNTTPVAIEGDHAILLAMHVTSREITRWTWQTFWWSPNPDKPPSPSSAAIADDRPARLSGAARNYSMALAYSMETPPQPNTGGKNVGNSVYAYNPWLEAGFGPDDLPASQPGTYDGKQVANNVGVQTNCMSCHAQASYSSTAQDLRSLYTGDQYIDMKGAQFKGNLRTDFLWSIPDSAR
jgi:hypothetical protein